MFPSQRAPPADSDSRNSAQTGQNILPVGILEWVLVSVVVGAPPGELLFINIASFLTTLISVRLRSSPLTAPHLMLNLPSFSAQPAEQHIGDPQSRRGAGPFSFVCAAHPSWCSSSTTSAPRSTLIQSPISLRRAFNILLILDRNEGVLHLRLLSTAPSRPLCSVSLLNRHVRIIDLLLARASNTYEDEATYVESECSTTRVFIFFSLRSAAATESHRQMDGEADD